MRKHRHVTTDCSMTLGVLFLLLVGGGRWSVDVDLAPAARELRRVLKPDGLLVLAFGDPESMRAMFPASVYTVRTATQIAGILGAAGFTDTTIETRETGGHAMYWLLARQRPSMIASDRSA